MFNTVLLLHVLDIWRLKYAISPLNASDSSGVSFEVSVRTNTNKYKFEASELPIFQEDGK